MTKTICKTGISSADHRTFGGIILESDFHTGIRKSNVKSGSAIARRIARDQSFDQMCRTNGEKQRMPRSANHPYVNRKLKQKNGREQV